MRIGGVYRGSSGGLGQVEEEVHEGPVRPVYRPGRTWMFTFLPNWARNAGARRRGLVGGATKLRRDCGQPEPRGGVRVWVGVPRRSAPSSRVSLPRSEK